MAFSDESERANTMLMAVVLISPGRTAAARTVTRSLLLARRVPAATHREGRDDRGNPVLMRNTRLLTVRRVSRVHFLRR